MRVRINGKPGRHAANLPRTGQPLNGGDEYEVNAEDALLLVTSGSAVVTTRPLPSWWPKTVAAVEGPDMVALVAEQMQRERERPGFRG